MFLVRIQHLQVFEVGYHVTLLLAAFVITSECFSYVNISQYDSFGHLLRCTFVRLFKSTNPFFLWERNNKTKFSVEGYLSQNNSTSCDNLVQKRLFFRWN